MFAPVRLEIAEHEAGDRLVLAGEEPKMSKAAQRLARWLARWREPADEEPVRLVRLACDRADAAMTLRWVPASGALVVERVVRSAELATARLRTVGVVGGGKLLQLTLVSTVAGQPAVRLAFRVAAVDRDDEVIDLALRIGRCAGLRGFRVRGEAPADVELVPHVDADGGSPYRASQPVFAIPAPRESIDYASAGTRRFVEPPETVEPCELAHAPEGLDRWRLQEWRPGARIEAGRPGRSRRAALLVTALVRLPLTVLATPLLVCFAWWIASMVVGLALGLLFAVLHFAGVFSEPLAAVLLVIAGMFTAVTSFWWGIARIGPSLSRRHRASLGRRVVIDWSTGAVDVLVGGALDERIEFEAVEAVAARVTWRTWVELQRAGDDVELISWRADEDRVRDVRARATALARALGVPVYWDEAEPPSAA